MKALQKISIADFVAHAGIPVNGEEIAG